MKNMDATVVQMVQAVEEGRFTGGIHTGTLAPYSLDPLVSEEIKADLEQIKADIIAGKIKTKP